MKLFIIVRCVTIKLAIPNQIMKKLNILQNSVVVKLFCNTCG